MRKINLIILLFGFLFFYGCQTSATENADQTKDAKIANEKSLAETSSGGSEIVDEQKETAVSNSSETNSTQTNQPKTLREFFALLPPKYFTLEGCEPSKDKNCDKARAEYIKTFLEIEDTKNGFWKSGCDGAQSCLTFALFKRPDSSYIVHLLTEFEMGEDSYFLEYKNGKWSDIGAEIVPEYSAKNTYIPPQKGTTVAVFKKNFPEPEYSERGAKIYDLVWNNGKFSIKK